MTEQYDYSIKVERIDENNRLYIERKSGELFVCDEITLNQNNEKVKVGTYFVHDYLTNDREWMEYNKDTIAFLRATQGIQMSEPQIVQLFDIKSKLIIEGSEDRIKSQINKLMERMKNSLYFILEIHT